MTRKEVLQIYHYDGLIERLQEEVEELQEKKERFEDAMLKSPKLNGMPRASGEKSDPTAAAGIAAAEIKKLIEEELQLIERYKYKRELARKEIYEYITTLDDPQLEKIIIYRCIDLKTWDQVAEKVGGGNTEGSVRMRFNRHFGNG